MKTGKIVVGILVVGLIATAGFSLNWLKTQQRLGTPGVVAKPTDHPVIMEIAFPSDLPGFTSSNLPQSEVVLGYLPKDTSYAQRVYWAEDGFAVTANIILQGTDRSSIHKADYCLAGQGFQTVKKETVMVTIPGPVPYEMPIAKWTIKGSLPGSDGQKREVYGVYSFWFVADGEQTVDNTQRILWFYRDLLTRRVLQRWAYVSYQAFCHPGQEDLVFDRMKELIVASVPQFQVPLASQGSALAARD
ncbi:MAG TPA: hypothetical protein VEH04_08375 [Verrucomicrobiae bacterium]|nr:hypothetical protein [Verrucomicrobiae bacterium]